MRYECIGDKIWAWYDKPNKDREGNDIIWRSFKKQWLSEKHDGWTTNWYAWFAWYSVKVEGKCVMWEVVWRQDQKWSTHSYAGMDNYKEANYRLYENRPEESDDE